MKKRDSRLLSLDALRGFDMCFIMGGELVLLSLSKLFPGKLSEWVAMNMSHSAWDGFTFYDLIFPLFLFLSGCSFPFSLSKQQLLGRSKAEISLKVLKRALLLIFLGVLYNNLLQFDFDNLRYASVLGRIGTAWAFAALLYIWLQRKYLPFVALGILLFYWLLLAFVPAPDAVGLSSLSMEGSIVGYIDRLMLPGVLYNEVHDPEGLLSTFPAIVTAMIGIFTGEYLLKKGVNGYKKVVVMLLFSLLLLFAGYIFDFVCPINKNLWSSSFVCCAGGWSLLLFALFYLVIDVIGCKRWAFPLCVIGMNSITIYMAQHFFDFSYSVNALFSGALRLLPEGYYALGYWCCYMLLCWLFLYLLYRKKIFLKV